MARLSFPIAIFFCLLACSRANQPGNGDATLADLQEHRMTSTILLPSEKPGYKAAALVQFDHDDDISSSGSARSSDDMGGSIPLTSVSFRPINRHYLRRHHTVGRSHCCRHGHLHHRAPGLRGHEGSHNVIPARQFPGRWVRVYRGKPRSGHMDRTWVTHASKPHLHRYARHAEPGGSAEYHLQRHHDKAKKEKDGIGGVPFMKIGKFLGRF